MEPSGIAGAAATPPRQSGRAAPLRGPALASYRFQAEDGTWLTGYRAGPARGPAMVLCNGLGGNVVVWHSLIEHFAARYRVLSWDYRGLYSSEPARDREAYSLPHHARDLARLIEHEALESPVIVGWSMGVQVALELHRLQPERVRAMVAIPGTHGQPLRSAFDNAVTELVSPGVFSAMRLVGDRLAGVAPSLARQPAIVSAFLWAGRRLGVMSHRMDRDVFQQLAEQWLEMDLAIYAEIFERMAEHDAGDLLASIRTPTLVLAGDQDRFTPAHLSSRMVEEMPDAELEIVKGATHFGLLEYPDAIAKAIDRYLALRFGDA